MFISHFNLQLKVFITIVPIAEILKKKSDRRCTGGSIDNI